MAVNESCKTGKEFKADGGKPGRDPARWRATILILAMAITGSATAFWISGGRQGNPDIGYYTHYASINSMGQAREARGLAEEILALIKPEAPDGMRTLAELAGGRALSGSEIGSGLSASGDTSESKYVSYLQPIVSSASSLYIREFTEAREAGALGLILAEAGSGVTSEPGTGINRAQNVPRSLQAGHDIGKAQASQSVKTEVAAANPPSAPSVDPLEQFKFDDPADVPGNISTPLDDPEGIVVVPAVPNENEGEVPGPVQPLHVNPDPHSDSLE